MTYTVDVMADITGFKTDIELVCHTLSVGDIIYNTYDVIDRVCEMTYKQWCVVSKCGCDVILSSYGVMHAVGVISYVYRV